MKIVFLVLMMLSQVSCASEKYGLSDHYDGTKFFNPQGHSLKTLWDVIKWRATGDRIEWPSWLENKEYDFPLIREEKTPIVTFINHASFLIQFPNANVLTDPIFSKRASPFTFIGPKRVRAPGLTIEKLPKIDLVVISHNHYDHLDIETLKALDEKFSPLFLVPLGDKKLLRSHGLKNVQELDWWDEVSLGDLKITFTQSYHWSARGLFDKCDSLWGAYYIQSPTTSLYFAGDTGYEDHFKTTKKKLGSPDLALLPIGAWAPRWFMKAHHMDPQEAVMAHKDLGAKKSIGMHFGTFQLTDEGYEDSQNMLKDIVKREDLVEDFFLLDHGESYFIKEE